MARIFNSYKLHGHLDTRRRELGISWNKLSQETGVHNAVIKGLSTGSSCQVEPFLKLLLWLGNTDITPYIDIVSPIDEEEEL